MGFSVSGFESYLRRDFRAVITKTGSERIFSKIYLYTITDNDFGSCAVCQTRSTDNVGP